MCMSNLKSVALTFLEVLAFNPLLNLGDVKGKLRSKFGEDRSKTGLTILAVVAGWADTGRTDGRTDGRTIDGWMDGRTRKSEFILLHIALDRQ